MQMSYSQYILKLVMFYVMLKTSLHKTIVCVSPQTFTVLSVRAEANTLSTTPCMVPLRTLVCMCVCVCVCVYCTLAALWSKHMVAAHYLE